ncbi:MAG TPA: hypothetical protein VLL75_11110 [Vicinamibacteria bacterium]|nr:hypothetical protein [Vicinamibacteria bacterium]
MAVALLLPTLVSLYLTALYNFAITGSVRPDALFLAWGPGGVTSARVGQGVLGLLLDARYGILPYVPVLMLAAGGLVVGGARRFALVIPAAVVYYLTVASADNWAGAVCNLGRYFMPVAPLAVALVAIAVDRALPPFRGAASAEGPRESPELALFLMLAAWTGLFAVALWSDPHAANDSALLLAKSTYADGHRYIPDLFIRRWADGAPGLWARIVVWLLGLVAIAWWVRGVSAGVGKGRRGPSPVAALAAVAAFVLSAGFVLERWPGRRDAPSFGEAMVLPGDSTTPAAVVFLSGAVRMRDSEAVLGPGVVELLLRASAAVSDLTVTVGGQGSVLGVEGRPPILLRPTGALVSVPFVPYHEVRGRDGRSVAFTRTTLEVEGEAVLRLGPGQAQEGDAPPAMEAEMEPEGSGDR